MLWSTETKAFAKSKEIIPVCMLLSKIWFHVSPQYELFLTVLTCISLFVILEIPDTPWIWSLSFETINVILNLTYNCVIFSLKANISICLSTKPVGHKMCFETFAVTSIPWLFFFFGMALAVFKYWRARDIILVFRHQVRGVLGLISSDIAVLGRGARAVTNYSQTFKK